MVGVDEQDENAIHLHPDALYQEPYLPNEMFLLCPVEQQGRWCRQGDEAVYECPCGAVWDVAPEDGQDGGGLDHSRRGEAIRHGRSNASCSPGTLSPASAAGRRWIIRDGLKLSHSGDVRRFRRQTRGLSGERFWPGGCHWTGISRMLSGWLRRAGRHVSPLVAEAATVVPGTLRRRRIGLMGRAVHRVRCRPPWPGNMMRVMAIGRHGSKSDGCPRSSPWSANAFTRRSQRMSAMVSTPSA